MSVDGLLQDYFVYLLEAKMKGYLIRYRKNLPVVYVDVSNKTMTVKEAGETRQLTISESSPEEIHSFFQNNFTLYKPLRKWWDKNDDD